MKLTKAAPVTTVLVSAATVFVDKWVIWYVILTKLLTDTVLQFILNFFAALNTRSRVKHLVKNAYEPKANGEVGRFNRTIFVHLWHNVAEHQTA